MTDESTPTPSATARNRSVLNAASTLLLSAGLVALAAITQSDGASASASNLASWWPVLVVLVLQCSAVIWSERAPTFIVVLVAAIPLTLVPADLRQISTVTTIPVMLAAYVAGTHSTGPRLRGGVIASASLVVTTATVGSLRILSVPSALISAGALVIVVLGVPLAIAFMVVTRRRMFEALLAEKEAVERMQGALLNAAIADERAGIARDLHDIAAHHMSGIALMCAVIDRQLDTDLGAARTGLQQIRAQSRLVLGDLRQAVGLLRGGAEQGIESHRIEAIRDLVDSAAAGPVDFRTRTREGHGDLGEGLGPLAHLAGYRMVQESLANAALHAPGAGREVFIDDAGESSLTVTVTNGPASQAVTDERPGGLGLRGMLERAELVGGVLEYGPTSDEGWRVSLELPRSPGSESRGTL